MSEMFDSRPIVERPAPDDVVRGPDHGVTVATREVTVRAYTCGKCGYDVIGRDHMSNHLRWGHPASRNPDLTCHAEYIATGGWCLRPKGHDGDHWTPSFNEGGAWWT